MRADMLAAAASAADAGDAAHHLGHQAVGIAGARQIMPMAAMVAHHQVAVDELAGNGHAGELLADAGMHRAEEFAFGK